jgi:hypothetical protein
VLGIFRDDVEHQLLLVGSPFMDLNCLKLFLLLKETRSDLRPENRQALLDVLYDHLVQVPAQERDSTSSLHGLIILARLEVNVLISKSVFDGATFHDIFLRAANDWDVS